MKKSLFHSRKNTRLTDRRGTISLLVSAALLFPGVELGAAVPELLIPRPAVDAKTSPVRARIFAERLAEVLRKGRYVRPRAIGAPCETRRRALEVARGENSDRVLFSRITKPGREYKVETEFINAENGRAEIRVSMGLPSLENRDLEAGVSSLARKMQQKLRAGGYRPERVLSWTDHARGLVPGLTQYARGQKSWALVLAGSSLFLLQRYLTQRGDWLDAQAEFQDPAGPLLLAVALRNQPGAGAAAGNIYTESLRERTRAAGRELNISLLLLGGLLAWNYLDAVNDYRYFGAGIFFSNAREFAAPGTYGNKGKARRRVVFAWRFEF